MNKINFDTLNLSTELQECVDACMDCHDACANTLDIFQHEAEFISYDHIVMLQLCMDTTLLCAKSILLQSNYYQNFCELCAEICNRYSNYYTPPSLSCDNSECLAACKYCAACCWNAFTGPNYFNNKPRMSHNNERSELLL